MKVIICTAGTSIATGVTAGRGQNGNKQEFYGAVRKRLDQLRQETGQDEAFLARASAETHSLLRLKLAKGDRVVLLSTDTQDGQWCAHLVAELIERYLVAEVTVHPIEGLQVTDEERFRKTGVENLFRRLDKLTQESADVEIVLNITGGFKAVVPYLTIYGLLKQLQVVYIFEQSSSLLHLPPIPINFDYERLARARVALKKLLEKSVMQKEEFFKEIGNVKHEERKWFEALLEEDERGQVTLSAFGVLLAEDYQRQVSEVLLSPNAWKIYDESPGHIRRQLDAVLANLNDPLWRSVHRHKFHQTDLVVFKLRKPPIRIAAIVQGSRIYVCELYLDHETYQKHLPRRQRADYQSQLSKFHVWREPDSKALGDTVDKLDVPAESKSRAERPAKRYLRSRRECKALKEENLKLRKQALQLRREFKALEEENSKLREQALQSARFVEELNQHIQILEHTNSELVSERNELGKQLQLCKQTVNDLTTQKSQLQAAWQKQKKCFFCWLLGF